MTRSIMPMTPDQFFTGGGGAPSFKFTQPGDSVTGKITDLQVVQQRAYSPGGVGELKTWPSGDPMMQLNVTLQTSLRDASIEDDDGKRRIYIDGRRIREAVKDAFTRVGEQGLAVGGTYTQKFTGYDPDSKNPQNPAKLYEVTYTPASAGTQFFQQPATATHDPADPASAAFVNGVNTTPAPAGQDALQAALANLSPEVRAALLAQTGNR